MDNYREKNDPASPMNRGKGEPINYKKIKRHINQLQYTNLIWILI